MTALDRGPVRGRVDGPMTQTGVIASEWLKFRSLRSTLLVLAAAMAGDGRLRGDHRLQHPQPGRAGP